jgi:hypothetical protein
MALEVTKKATHHRVAFLFSVRALNMLQQGLMNRRRRADDIPGFQITPLAIEIRADSSCFLDQ